MFDSTVLAPPPEALVDAWAGVDVEELIRRDPLFGVDAPDAGSCAPDPDGAERSPADVVPSGWLGLDLDVTTADPSRLDDADLIDAIVGFDHLSSWAEARQARLLAEFARRRPGDAPGAANCELPSMISRFAPDEIGLALHLSRGTAIARLGRAAQLQRVLPATLDAWEQGRIDESKVRAICDATRVLDDDRAALVQHRVLSKAAEQTAAQLRAGLKRAVIAVDPDGAAARHREARRDRRVSIGQENDGMGSLWALLPAPGASSAYQWLTRLARGLGKEDPRGMDARRADLLVDLLTGQLAITTPHGDGGSDCTDGANRCDDEGGSNSRSSDGGDGGNGSSSGGGSGSGGSGSGSGGSGSGGSGSGGSGNFDDDEVGDASGRGPSRRPPVPATPGKPLVQVVMPYTTLIGADDQPCELVGYGAIPADLAREIAADAVWKRLVTDPLSGALLDHGRTTYRPPAALSDYVRARDVHCRFPPCRRRAIDTELDHAIAFGTAGGDTVDTNLYGACVLHHHLKHDAPGWSVTQQPNGRITWTTPAGHRYTSDPYDYRPEPDVEKPSGAPAPGARTGRAGHTPALDWGAELTSPDSVAATDADEPPF